MKMSEAARQARRDYHRQWRKHNADSVRRHQLQYWERRAAKQQAQEGN